MSSTNIAFLVIGILIGAVILYLVIAQNLKDKRKFEANETEDVMEEIKNDQQRKSDHI